MTGAEAPTPSGFLVVYKPVGPGSQRLLGPLRRLTHTRRVGHVGTLDPFASGVLPVAVGRSTRLIETLHAEPKEYRAELRLGLETTTGDLEGEVTRQSDPPALSRDDIRSALGRFVGELWQTPPAHSAIKVGGRRSYELARRGEPAELPARRVRVHNLSLVSLEADRLTFDVACSSGTYVRSLGRDLALALGSVGSLTRLVRTRVGPFGLADARTLEELEAAVSRLGLSAALLPPDAALAGFPALALSPEETRAIRNGAPIPAPQATPDGPARGYEPEGVLLALLEPRAGTLAARALLK
jgi:tRNA pseudouridine55 synthase